MGLGHLVVVIDYVKAYWDDGDESSYEGAMGVKSVFGFLNFLLILARDATAPVANSCKYLVHQVHSRTCFPGSSNLTCILRIRTTMVQIACNNEGPVTNISRAKPARPSSIIAI